MNALAAKIGLLLTAALFAACLVWALLQPGTDSSAWPALAARAAFVALGAGGCAALLVHGLVGRRLRHLTQRTAAQHGNAAGVPPLPWASADPHGDEIDRLALQVQQLAACHADQHEALQRLQMRQHELLANVSHDLRTPLASLQGYLQLLLLRRGSLDAAEELNYLATAARQSERLGRLVGDLFDLTLLEEGRAPPQCEDFVAAELAQDVLQKFALDARQRQVSLHAECAAAPALQVHADIHQIEQVLEDLVDNALRHTPAGGRVTLHLAREPRRARFAVEDTGCGIAADALPHLFDHYEHADRRGRGRIGLRLAIARHRVRQHGGELEVSSTVGQGSRFAFALPLADSSSRRNGAA